ncbi:hypothetical protein [Lyngbya aestuarii]|uniref:hypothetical protein n=1 Tax=Lyngbya aestuarii TaxID=118322 RepID=UPI00403DCEE4
MGLKPLPVTDSACFVIGGILADTCDLFVKPRQESAAPATPVPVSPHFSNWRRLQGLIFGDTEGFDMYDYWWGLISLS